jgi:hypothetical protein
MLLMPTREQLIWILRMVTSRHVYSCCATTRVRASQPSKLSQLPRMFTHNITRTLVLVLLLVLSGALLLYKGHRIKRIPHLPVEIGIDALLPSRTLKHRRPTLTSATL